jgi:hypothetical protein
MYSASYNCMCVTFSWLCSISKVLTCFGFIACNKSLQFYIQTGLAKSWQLAAIYNVMPRLRISGSLPPFPVSRRGVSLNTGVSVNYVLHCPSYLFSTDASLVTEYWNWFIHITITHINLDRQLVQHRSLKQTEQLYVNSHFPSFNNHSHRAVV